MKIIPAILALLVGAAQATYHPYYHGYNPFAALAALGLYNPHVAPQVPYSGTYSYHDGHRPTVVQANNDGYKFPHAVNSLWNPWNPWVAPAAAPVVAPVPVPAPVPAAALVAAPVSAAPAAVYHYYGHPGQPYHYSIPQKTVVQANLGGHDPWNYGAFYGTGIYGFKYNNYAPAAVPVLRIE